MAKRFLVDTNSVIDYLDNKLPENSADIIEKAGIILSVITRIELLSWQNATTEQTVVLESFISNALVENLSEFIIIKTIEIRKNYRIKLPDAIIAATALINGLTLITRNTSDFKNIEGLDLLNSWNTK